MSELQVFDSCKGDPMVVFKQHTYHFKRYFDEGRAGYFVCAIKCGASLKLKKESEWQVFDETKGNFVYQYI